MLIVVTMILTVPAANRIEQLAFVVPDFSMEGSERSASGSRAQSHRIPTAAAGGARADSRGDAWFFKFVRSFLFLRGQSDDSESDSESDTGLTSEPQPAD